MFDLDIEQLSGYIIHTSDKCAMGWIDKQNECWGNDFVDIRGAIPTDITSSEDKSENKTNPVIASVERTWGYQISWINHTCIVHGIEFIESVRSVKRNLDKKMGGNLEYSASACRTR